MGVILIDVITPDNHKIKMDLEYVLKCELAKLDICGYNMEVIKAITILKRSELVKRIKNLPYSSNYKGELCINDEVFRELGDEDRVILEKVVDETSGYFATSSGKAVDLFFTINCGGGTANSEDVIGYRLNYLRKILCKYCVEKHAEDIIKVTDLVKRLNAPPAAYKEEINGIINDVTRDETGRIISLKVMNKYMTGEEFSKIIGAKSSRMYFVENSIILKTVGVGNGLGICLDGAEYLARSGKDYKEIIEYYYTGIILERLDENVVSRTLIGKKIIIDAGHGGKDIGNMSLTFAEKDANLRISIDLYRMLKDIGADVTLTRSEDVDMPTGDRVKFINDGRPEFFISIHQNNFMLPGVNGVEAYCYKNDEDALKVGRLITKQISEKLEIKNRGVREGDYYILRETIVSGLILECMYMTGNMDSVKYTNENLTFIAQAIFKGICEFYEIEP